MEKFNGKKLIILGDRDGVDSSLMEKCFANREEVAFSATECFL